jgi:hypothetical protein
MGAVRKLQNRLLAIFSILLIGSIFLCAPALAQKVPDKLRQEALIKATLLSFNDANVTGNYAVLHAKLSKPFRDQFSPERLKEVFKEFHEKQIDFDIIAAKPPIMSQEPQVTDEGKLMLYGYFDTSPSRVYYELDFIMSDGEWKPTKINVSLRKP